MSEPFDHLLKAYAKLVIRVGVNVQVGQRLEITALPEQAAVARALAEEAYRVGARHVAIDYVDPYLQRFKVEHGPEDALGYVRPSEIANIEDWDQDRPAVITLTGNPLPDLMDGLDAQRLASSVPLPKIMARMRATMSNEVAWTVVAAPTQGWADSIGVGSLAELWDAVAIAMRLDEDDPIQAWQDHNDLLHHRRDILDARHFDRIRYRGPGTDITVGLSPAARWTAAGMANARGDQFVANMPTEEIFLSPDWRRADGFVRTTAPFFLVSMGAMVEGLEVEFSDGSIVGARAERGEGEVQKQFELVPRSRHLGEIAIVDGASRVRKTGLTFKDMLYDENIGSHIAWGAGFPFLWENGNELTPEQRIESGLNQSSTHVDIVIGSAEVQIDGIAADGTVVPIVEGDEFVLTEA